MNFKKIKSIFEKIENLLYISFFFGNDINFLEKKKNLVYFLKTYIKVGFFPNSMLTFIYIYMIQVFKRKKKQKSSIFSIYVFAKT